MKKEATNRNDFCRAMDHYMASLIQKRDFATVVKYYEDNRSELEAADGALAGSVHHRAVMAYSALSKYPAALKTARVAQHLIAEQADSLLLAELFLTLGWVLRNMDEWKEAEKCFRDAESIFRRKDCPEGQSRALNLLAGLFFRRGDYKSSLAPLMEAIDLVRKLNDRKKLAYMMGNLGRVFTFSGDFKEAKRYLEFNIDLSTKLSDWKEVTRAQIALGYVYIQQAEFGKAEQSLDDTYRQSVAVDNPRNQAFCLCYLGELFYRTGRFREAAETLERALALTKELTPNTTLAGRVMRHLAELQIRLENYSAAQRFVAKAMAVMRKVSNKIENGALWKIKAIVAEANGQEAEGRESFVKAIDILRETGVQFEEAEALIAAGTSNLFTERQRLTYLFRAEEFYRRSGLSVKLQQIERIINSIDYPPVVRAGTASSQVASPPDGTGFLTGCPTIKRFKAQLPIIGRSDLPLLLTGETGVGKDHMARYYYSLVRPDSPFMVVNCASLPETLLESELFGYRRGAFTGADTDKQGLFVAANGGILYLDEIGDMPLSLQAKLLGVLETRCLIPLGSTEEILLDIKLVVATNKDLEEMVERGAFRRDLYYRLSGLTFHIPPLRNRKEDIPVLLRHFMEQSHLLDNNDPIPTELTHQFVEYDWPGNTRELRNMVKRLEVMAELMAEGDLVELSRSIFSTKMLQDRRSLFDRVEQFERKMIVEALLMARGNKSKAARILGIHEATIRTKMKRYHINVEGGIAH
jgi:DNA-binding NtrC family response regulator/tetratricopeptide (TPR) repeat protein